MRVRGCCAVMFLGVVLQAQGCWPLVPPPPPPPDASKGQLAEWPAYEWAGHHQAAVLKGLFRDDLGSPPEGGTVVLIRCFPAFAPPYQMELIRRPGRVWTLKGWFLEGRLITALASLKLKSPALSDTEAVEALRIRPAEVQADLHEKTWSWLARIRPGRVPRMPRAIPQGTDGTLVCWLESTPGAGIVEAQLQDWDSLSAISDTLLRMKKRLHAIHDPNRVHARP